MFYVIISKKCIQVELFSHTYLYNLSNCKHYLMNNIKPVCCNETPNNIGTLLIYNMLTYTDDVNVRFIVRISGYLLYEHNKSVLGIGANLERLLSNLKLLEYINLL